MDQRAFASPSLVRAIRSGHHACPFAHAAPGLDLLTLDHFGGCVNDTFQAQLDGMQVEFVLVEARPLPVHGTAQAARAPFSLLFRNTSAVLFPQQIYPMQHARLGEMGIFLVPVAQERGGFLYQAVFN